MFYHNMIPVVFKQYLIYIYKIPDVMLCIYHSVIKTHIDTLLL